MFSTLNKDFRSGLGVFLVAVPLCLWIALASGAPAIAGLRAGIIGGIVVGFLSKSPLSVSGPAAGLVAIVIAAISKIGFDGFLVALIIAGILQILFGVLKLAKYAHYVPHSVIKGMLAAIGMTLIIKQWPVLFGVSKRWDILTHYNVVVLVIGVISLVVMFAREKRGKKHLPALPGSLIAVVIGLVWYLVYRYVLHGTLQTSLLIQLPAISSLVDVKNIIHFPVLSTIQSLLSHYQLRVTAVTIALVASIETILSVKAIDGLDPQKRITPLDWELIAQGIGNALSWFIGWLPITSVIIRSSVNLNAGAQSKLSCIIHGILIVTSLLLLSSIINLIPLTSLAAVLLLTGYNLTKIEWFIKEYKVGWIELASMLITFFVQLATDLLIGVASGLVFYYIATYLFARKDHQSVVEVVDEQNEKDVMEIVED